MKHKLEFIPKAIAEKLEAHANVLQTLIIAQRRGAAEQFGYAFLAGRALLQAKAIVPNGNSPAPNAGFKNWVAANLPEITMRTAENWMLFAESIIARAQVDAVSSPLLLGSVEINGSAHDSILQLVPEIMDNKGMMRFMRDSRLLRRRKRSRNPPAQIIGSLDDARGKCARACRAWNRLLADIEKSLKTISDIENVSDLKRYLDVVVAAGDEIRTAIKVRKVAAS